MKSGFWSDFCPNFDFTVKVLISSNSLNHCNFQTKADMNVKIGSFAKLCTQNKNLATKTLTKSQITQDFRFRTNYLEKVDCSLEDFCLKPSLMISWHSEISYDTSSYCAKAD